MTTTQAVETYVGGEGKAPLLLTCEHATNKLPSGWSWRSEDDWIRQTHWAWDPGAADLTRALADRLGATAVLAGFSRLLIDPNRPLDSETLFRERADDRDVALNQNLSETERQSRIEQCYQPYHRVLAEESAKRPEGFVLSLHSFTPNYEGKLREVQVGVMQVDNLEMAQFWRDELAATGLEARIDEPYAGADGFMFAVERCARAGNSQCMMLEFRQDLIDEKQDILVDGIVAALKKSGVI